MTANAGWTTLTLLCCASCAYDGARFTISRGELPDSRGTVSVFGVYQDGRMSPESWPELGPRVAAMFGRERCEPLFGDRLRGEDPERFERLEREAKQDGISADLTKPFAARATGAFIATLQLFGRPPSHERVSNPATPSNAARASRGSGGRGNRGGGTGHIREERSDDHVLEVSLLLISVATHQPALTFTMQYTGSTVEDALDKFALRLRGELPDFTCVEWRWPEAPTPGVVAP